MAYFYSHALEANIRLQCSPFIIVIARSTCQRIKVLSCGERNVYLCSDLGQRLHSEKIKRRQRPIIFVLGISNYVGGVSEQKKILNKLLLAAESFYIILL